jgi:hypothetical protein
VSLTKAPEPDESTLVRYLIGRASEEETERLDELSTVDEEFALRLRAVEHDLVDAYVNGELAGDTLDGFRSQYLRSPSGVAAVEFASALRGYRRASPRRFSQWPLAAAMLLVATSAWILVDDWRLRGRLTRLSEGQVVLQQRARGLQEDLERQQAATQAAAEELARVREAQRPGAASLPDELNIASFALGPQLRGAAMPTLHVPRGADYVTLQLELESPDEARYRAELKSLADGRSVWRKGSLEAQAGDRRRVIVVTLRSGLLASQRYMLELSVAGAADDVIASYPFRVIKQ